MTKRKVKKVVSGLLSAITILTSIVQPISVYAAEAPSYEDKYPALEKVRDMLDKDEIVIANDYEVEVGSNYEVKIDFSGLDINSEKVKVAFEEAKSSDGKDFDINHKDSYKAVYLVEPVSGNPSYHVSRKITVKEPVVELQSEKARVAPGETVQTEEEESEDEESELTVDKALTQAEEQGIDVMALDVGESVTFYAATGANARAMEQVTLTRGDYYYYSTYGYGTYLTCKFTVHYGGSSATAYCVQPSKAPPPSGTYSITKLGDSKALAKVCYYGTKASAGEGFFEEKYSNFSEGQRTILVHIAASYANGSSDAFTGTSETGKALAMELYNYCMAQPEIPDVAMSFSDSDVKAYVDGNAQRTKEITFKADEQQTITFKLPKGVKFHNVTTGKTSATGANVEVTGGTRFYLSAPLTQTADVSGSWSATMKGSITKDYSAYKITTGGTSQDLAFVFGEGTTDEKYVDFSVKWLELAKVKVIKVDSNKQDQKLAGAVFGIYEDKNCTKLITQMPKTDGNGASMVEIVKTQDTVYLKEITAPTGYRLNTSAYNVTLVASQTTTVTVPDKEQLGELTVYKEGQVLCGADVTASGTVFKYEKRRQANAIFNVYAGADIYTAYGAQVYKKGDLVKSNLVTDSNGSATLKNLHLGTYVVKEMQAPVNFYNSGEEQIAVLSYAGQNVEVVFSEKTFTNERQKAKVSVVKKDKDTLNPLDGGIFGLYAGSDIATADGVIIVQKGTLIEKLTTGKDGSATFKADLPIGFSYSVKEEQAPEGYLRNQEDIYTFKFAYTNDRAAAVSFTHTFVNERVDAKISLVKKDAETNKSEPQGDATLDKAVYGLYAREDIVHPDGATGILYKAGEKVATLTTDQNGNAFIENLYLGNYYVKEITPPVGYLADEAEHDLICNYEEDLVATVERSCISPEQVKKQPFQIIKVANNGKTDADLLKGAGFTAYLVSSLKVKADGSYDFESATPVVIGENGATEMFTDERGYACSIALPYGTYVVRETTTPHNYTPVNDFIVRITEHHPNTPQVWRVLLDDEFEAKLKIIKQDDETKKSVLAKDTEFKVYDLDNKKYVEQVTTYPTTVVHTSFFTDEQGYLILPQNLKIGNYRIEEVQAPFGYTLNENYYEVAVDTNTAYQMDSVSGDAIIEVIYENHPVKGELHVVKQGEILNGFKDDFTYEVENLANAVFEVYAAEDIYTADFQKDGEGNRIQEYASGELVETLTTDENGEAWLKNLPLGAYKVVEITAPHGFVLNETEQNVTFVYVDQNTPVIKQTVTFENDRQKVEVSVVKLDAETKAEVAGAVFGLYAKEDILAHGELIVKADTLLGEATSGEDGKAVFALDLPFENYYIKELAAPAGYVSSDDVLEITADYQGQDVDMIYLTAEFENEPTKIAIKKTDITTGVELDGAKLTVLNQEGNVVDTWVSVKGEEHLIERLTVGETYTLREELAPYGYLQAEEITFTVQDTAEIQKVEIKDAVPTGTLIINKKGEFLDNVSVIDSIGGWISHLFEYITGALRDVTFEVYALEDIKAADGESDNYYKKDELIATITTDATGYAKLEDLPLGKYYVKETETVEGYVLDGEIREVDLTYRDQYTAEVLFSTDWQNNRQKAEVSIIKTEKDSDRVLQGAVFALCVKEDIVNAGGKVIMEADTVIEEKATGEDGKLIFTADLPIGYSYYVKETAPAPGFATTDEVQEFEFTYEDAEKKSITYEFTFENEPTVFEFTKTALTDGKEVEGAKLQIIDESGKLVEEWVSGKELHIIRELEVGKTYTMVETMAPDGYVTAESIRFTVEDTGEVQKVEMKDDVTKVEISKTDISGKELPGAKLEILDANGKKIESWTSGEKPHYIEMLPVGEYTLREEMAPEGYLIAGEVKFTIEETGEIQKVVMVDEVEPPAKQETPTPSGSTPKTGDESNIKLWLILAGIALAALCGSVFALKKKKD